MSVCTPVYRYFYWKGFWDISYLRKRYIVCLVKKNIDLHKAIRKFITNSNEHFYNVSGLCSF
jgi:hypothetical protein